MKQNGTWLAFGGGIRAKRVIALILIIAMALAMLCATAEDSDVEWMAGEAVYSDAQEIAIGEDAVEEGDMDLELAEDAALDVEALPDDELVLDGLENNLDADGLTELDIAAEAPAEARTSNESSPEDFEIDENGVLVKYKGEGGDVVIPDGVTSIGDSAFSHCTNLTSVTIPDSVTSIAGWAFLECSSLTSVTIPNTVTSIGPATFSGCSSLTSVTIPDSVTSIGYGAFYGCSSLTSVTLPDSVTSINAEVFYECTSLSSVTIPDSVTSIDDFAFNDCSSLTNVTIPNSVTSIGEGAFSGCSSLTNVTIPDSVTSIGEGAFCCDSLKSVTIGSGLSFNSLSSSHLLDNDATEAITVTENNKVYASKDGVLYTYNMSTLLRCPEAKASVTIPDSVISIGDEAFCMCVRLTSVTIPDSVIIIGEDAFQLCENLTSMTIPDSVTSIGGWAFCGCSSLTSVTIPDSVTSIGEGAFKECDSLTSMTIPSNVTSIAESVFDSCRSLTSVTIPNTVTSIGDDAFYWCECLTSVNIPDSVTSIGVRAFKYCESLTSVTIPDSVVSLGDMAFFGCKALKDVYIPSSIKKIQEETFYDNIDGDEEDFNDDTRGPLDLTIHGYRGSYAETYAKKYGFKFSPLDRTSLAKAKLTVKAQVYSGKAKKPAVKVVLNGKTLKKGTDYTVSYKNNKAIGTATVTVKGKGNYTGTAKKTFKINPKAVSGLKLKAGKGRLTVSWKKSAGGIGGYQLQYGLKKSFSGAKKATVSKASTVKGTIKNLKKGKIYYVRIRAFKKVGKTTYWSAWSAAKKAKVK